LVPARVVADVLPVPALPSRSTGADAAHPIVAIRRTPAHTDLLHLPDRRSAMPRFYSRLSVTTA
jgi:hypothetical protein